MYGSCYYYCLNRIRIVWIKSSAILIALVIGYILAGFYGISRLLWSKRCTRDSNSDTDAFWLKLLMGLIYSNGIYLFGYVFRSGGDVTATSKLSNQPVDGPQWMQRIKGGVLVNGANSLLAGLFNTFPSSVFAQNNGVIN